MLDIVENCGQIRQQMRCCNMIAETPKALTLRLCTFFKSLVGDASLNCWGKIVWKSYMFWSYLLTWCWFACVSYVFNFSCFRDLSAKVQEKFYEYLDERGVNDELAVFLHEYMMNKDRIELLRWMDSLKSFVDR